MTNRMLEIQAESLAIRAALPTSHNDRLWLWVFRIAHKTRRQMLKAFRPGEAQIKRRRIPH